MIPKITEDIVDRRIPGGPSWLDDMANQRGGFTGRELFRQYEDQERAKRGDTYKYRGPIVKGAV